MVLGTINVFAQGQSCAPYNQNRTLSEMKEILMRDGTYYDNLRIKYAEAINYNIGKNVISSDKEGIRILLENTDFIDSTFVRPEKFQNGVKYGDNVRFTNLLGQPSLYWAAMHYCGNQYIFAKVACINPQKSKKPGVYQEASTPESAPAPTQPQAKEDNSLPTDVGGKKKVLAETPPLCPKPNLNLNQDKSTCWSRMTKTERRLVRVGVSALTLTGAYFIINPFGGKSSVKEVVVEKPFHPVDANPQGMVKSKGITISLHF